MATSSHITPDPQVSKQKTPLTQVFINSELASQYLELCKPKVVFVMLITAWVGMLLALTGLPSLLQLSHMLLASIGITLCASSSAVVNHVVDQWRDQKMQRTQHRPIAKGKISRQQAMIFAALLLIVGCTCLAYVNLVCLILTLCATIGYAILYTLVLKPITPQNITIGGIAGALPPLLGWTAVSPEITAHALLLVLIIFTWTPPHFWALALYRVKDYQKAEVPMLPVTHGQEFTRLHILLYSVLLVLVTALPWLSQFSSWLYLVAISYLNLRFLSLAWRLYSNKSMSTAQQLFRYSIVYLLGLFLAILADRMVFFWV
ncbi:heme o synthase [Litoribrevibacter euphylliae]|uniref:Protoheme IX farnesyltransferase n=1 Tax=Litoribrevibacter euphylliae TaxID=1834034 RepID=A0ABV7HAF3_9GAMM